MKREILPDDVFLHGMDFTYRFLRQPDLSAPDTRQPALLWQTVLCFRLEAAPASYGKHGFTRGAQHPHRLPFQHFQHLLRRNGMGSERHRMAHLFRCFRDDHHLRADRQMSGRKGERQYGEQHPTVDGHAAEDRPTGDSREDGRHQ